jgi:murein hydrolase activator
VLKLSFKAVLVNELTLLVIFVSDQGVPMRIIAVIFCSFIAFTSVAQKQTQLNMSKEEMMAKRKEIQEAINETERQLEQLKGDKKATMGQLRALQSKLAERQNLIANINEEMYEINNTIKSSSKEVDNLKLSLAQLKIRYAQSIRYSYETRSSYDMLAFLFSSNDFNDAMRRMKYLKKFREYRKQQVDQIRTTQDQLQHKIGVLSTQKKQKDELLSSQEEQKQKLLNETNQTNAVMQELKGKESELIKSIEKNRTMAMRVDRYIKMVVDREIAKANKQAEEEKKKEAELAKTNPPTKPTGNGNEHVDNNPPLVTPRPRRPAVAETRELMLTPTDVTLAKNFEGNRGKMYWPVEKGVITDHFGVHPHPLEPKVKVDNAGIDIQTTPGAAVKTVFEGVVSSISTVENYLVLIKSGDYICVYNNLKGVSVKVGDHVSTNQVIGSVANNDEGVPTIKFQIWKMSKRGSSKLNPEQWLGRAR